MVEKTKLILALMVCLALPSASLYAISRLNAPAGESDLRDGGSVEDIALEFLKEGAAVDDFFRPDGSGALSAEELRELRERLVIDGRRRDLYVVLYSHQLGLPVGGHLALCDKITFWTWHSEDLASLEANFERLEALAPDHGKLLGCYLWDYGNKAPRPLDRMKRQCELGLRWLREGRLEGLIFLANTVCDLELDAVEWTRRWIAEVGTQPAALT